MEELVKQMMLVYQLMAKDEFADVIATMLWNFYTKCKEKGFSDSEAMEITLNFSKSHTNKK